MNQNRHKILFLSPRFPFPLIGGDHVKCYHLLKHLSTLHEVTFVTFNHGSNPTNEQIKSITDLGIRLVALPLNPITAAIACIRTFFTDMPLEIAFYYNHKFASEVDKLCSNTQFDIGISFFMRSAEYIRHKKFTKILIAEDCRTMYQQRSFEVSTSWKQKIIRWWEVYKLKKYETSIVNDFDRTTLVTKEDIEAMKRQSPKAKYNLLTNGVDLSKFVANLSHEGRQSVLFAGKLDVWANEMMIDCIIKEIAPRVHAILPDVIFNFVGANPQKSLVSLAEKYPLKNRINIIGTVPHLQKYYHEAGVFIHPHSGASGIQNKLLEAMACGCPVVTSTSGSQGIPVKDKEDILIGKNVDELAENVVKLLMNQSLRETLAKNAIEKIQQFHSWESIYNSLDEIIKELELEKRI
ncbi:MAG: glycosyltransferase [Bacteroidetes bacterium]|nr:glycosyltransferase [Bacteroidota bacterium]